jgi:GAF domain-containing protein
LDTLTEALSCALTEAEIVRAVLRHGIPAAGACAGALVRADGGGEDLEVIGTSGYPAEIVERWKRFGRVPASPIGQAVTTGEAVILSDWDAWLARFPGTAEATLRTDGAWAALPLLTSHREVTAALALTFDAGHLLDDDEVTFLRIFARQCAQALERVRFCEAEQRARARAEALVVEQNAILERIALGAPLNEVLGAITSLIEQQAPGVLCSVLLLGGDRLHLRLGAGPSLPEEYAHALRQGFPIGPEIGSCGAAAYRKESVIVGDIAGDPKWAPVRDLPLRHGLRACWSTPILGARDEVLGTFGVFFRESRGPNAREHELVQVAVHVTRIAIERHHEERSRRVFLRDMLAGVSEGRLLLCDTPADLPAPLAAVRDPLPLRPASLRVLRQQVESAAAEIGLPRERGQDLAIAVGEASLNAVVHGRDGYGQVHADADQGKIQVWIRDHGDGIAEEMLHRATLERGFTTAGTMGHGFWMILRTCDLAYLLTGASGTTLVLEQGRTPRVPAWLRERLHGD